MVFRTTLFLIPALTSYILGHAQITGTNLELSTASQTAAASSSIASAVPSGTTTPDQISEPLNINLDGRIFPPSILTSTQDKPEAFTIDCIDCTINATFSLSAGGEYLDIYTIPTPSDVTEIPSDFDFTDHWVAATVDKLDAEFEFEISLNVTDPNNPFVIPIINTTITKNFGLATITATLTLEVHGWANTTIDSNLTYGFTFSVPPGSELIIDISEVSKSVSLGFNNTSLEPIPLQASTSDLDIDLEISLRPIFDFVVSLGAIGLDVDFEATVTLDVPKLDLSIEQVHNVNSTCDPAPSSLSQDQIYPNLTMIVPSIGLDAFEVFTEDAKAGPYGSKADQRFSQNYSKNITTACFFYDQAQKTLGPVPATKPSSQPSSKPSSVSSSVSKSAAVVDGPSHAAVSIICLIAFLLMT